MSDRINKARYWQAVLYPENMPDDWENQISDVVQVPYAYCIHSSDTDTKSEHRKDHVHLILAFPNTTTYNHALKVFKLLGENAANTCQACVNIRHCYDYLIHDTEACKKAKKHLYSPSERITGNNFDIGAYEQLTQEEKDEMLEELCEYVVQYRIQNAADAYVLIMQNFGREYFPIYRAHNAFIDRLTRGNYLKYAEKEPKRGDNSTQNSTHLHAKTCPECGSEDLLKSGKTAGGNQRFECRECGKRFV